MTATQDNLRPLKLRIPRRASFLPFVVWMTALLELLEAIFKLLS